MTLKKLEEILSQKTGSTKEFPFGDEVMVFKVMNKMFALISLDKVPLDINLKALPQDALAFREIYECVTPGYHMNKKHWNTITIDGTMKDDILKNLIEDSYNLVVEKLTKKQKQELLLKD